MGLFNTHICKNCFKSYEGKPEVCPNCGVPIEYKHKAKKEVAELQPDQDAQAQEIAAEKSQKPKKEKRRRLSDQEIMDSINFDELLAKTNDADVKSWREKRKKDKNKIEVETGEDGYNVDVKDVSYLPSTYTYSAKKARGEYKTQKIEWWEIYKWADLLLARRKVKKQVNRASHYRPAEFNPVTTIVLCLLFGYMGAHNFYVRNWRKGLVSLFCVVLGSVIALHPFFAPVKISIGGGLLFVAVFIWVLDFINLCINQFSYRLSKWKFIDSLNTDTRAKLGYKYIDKQEYKRAWVVRVAHSIKRSSEERKARRAAKQAEINDTNQEQVEQAQEEQTAQENEEKKQQNNSAKKSNKNSKNAKKQPKIIKKNKNKKK